MYNIPIPLQGIISNNTLEYIAEIITIWFYIIEGSMEKEDCVLALYDSYSATRWTFKSNFDNANQWGQSISERKLATIVIDAKIFVYGQYL